MKFGEIIMAWEKILENYYHMPIEVRFMICETLFLENKKAETKFYQASMESTILILPIDLIHYLLR